MKLTSLCLCCSGKLYDKCCKPYHAHIEQPEPLALMRSRYCAYALHLVDYIIETTHPECSNYQSDLLKWRRDIQLFCKQTAFKRLEIIDYIPGSKVAYVSFKAYLRQEGKPLTLQEKSRFEKINSHWVYREAEKIF